MRKLILVLLCAFASFAFSDPSVLEKNSIDSPCDGFGSTVIVLIEVDCENDGNLEVDTVVKTCRNQLDALLDVYGSLCD